MNLSHITCIEDLRKIYHRRTPKMFVDYCEAGSWTESTLRANVCAFEKILFRQKVLRDLSNRTLESTMLGEKVTMPLALAPVGMCGMQYPDGEILAARAAEKFGVPFILSTVSICSLEDVAAHTQKPFWFQLYMMKDRGFMRQLLARAKAVGCSALVLTADLQVLGQRHMDIKNGLSAPPKPTFKNLINLATKWHWGMRMLNTPRRTFGNIIGHAAGVSDPTSLASWSAEQFDLQLSWKDIEWLKGEWGGKLVIKGIMDGEDARHAAQSGVDAIVISNHGGRQLDGAPASITMLPEVLDSVQNRCEVWVDGGIRSGQDMLKAVALGANAVLAGRAYLYALGAFGEAGVRRALEIMYHEADVSMALCGQTNIQAVNQDILYQK